MKIDIHKITAIVAVIILAAAVIWWTKWQKQEERPPTIKDWEDSIDYHIDEAQKHADIAHKYFDEVEKLQKVYHDPRIDSVERAKLGAEIWANAIRKADSLRERTP